MKKFLALLLTAVMCLSCMAFAESADVYALGSPLPDFTFTAIDGTTYTLSEVLKEKEMVLINLWATWCSPCEYEFPYMEEAYEQYKDKIEIFALTIEETDDDATLTEYAESHGMTFPIGHDDTGFFASFGLSGIPTSIVVDRFGNVAFLETGSQTSTSSFVRLFEFFLGDDYTETTVLNAIPAAKPTVAAISEDDLNTALNVEGGTLSFTNPTDEYTWPMQISIDGEHQALVSSNAGEDGSTSAVFTTVTVEAGDVLAFDYKVSSEASADLLTLYVNGTVAKVFGGERGWATYGYEFTEAGTYEIELAYVKDQYESTGDDIALFDNVRVVSGEEAAAVLAGNPVYPATTKSTNIEVKDGKQLFFVDPKFSLMSYFGLCSYYVMDDVQEITLKITLDDTVDPDAAFVYNQADGLQYALCDAAGEDAYYLTMPIDRNATTGYPYTMYSLYATASDTNPTVYTIMASETNVNATMAFFNEYDFGLTGWKYADGTLPSTDECEEAVSFGSTYVISCVDQNGDPVPGVTINVCTDESCTPMPVDDDGVLTLTAAPYAYVLHVLVVPEGYEYDTDKEIVAPEEGGEITFVLTKL